MRSSITAGDLNRLISEFPLTAVSFDRYVLHGLMPRRPSFETVPVVYDSRGNPTFSRWYYMDSYMPVVKGYKAESADGWRRRRALLHVRYAAAEAVEKIRNVKTNLERQSDYLRQLQTQSLSGEFGIMFKMYRKNQHCFENLVSEFMMLHEIMTDEILEAQVQPDATLRQKFSAAAAQPALSR